MLAATFAGPGQLEVKNIPDPVAGKDGLVLRVGANTVCGTDLRILRGEKSAGIDIGVVLGHEIAGHVVEVGREVQGYEIGDLVALNPTIPCGRCHYCFRGLEHLCMNSSLFGYRVNGGLAEYVRVPAEALNRGGVYKVDPSVSAVEAALSEPLGCVINGAKNYEPKLGDTVLIMGAGPIGLLHLQMVKHLGASVVVVSDPSSSRCEMARTLGATHTINPMEVDPTQFMKDITGGLGADLVIVCIGRPELLQQAFTAARKRGHISAFAGFPKGVMAEVDPNLIHYGEFSVSGASNAGNASQELALQLITEGSIDVKSLHTHTFKLEDVEAGIEFVSSGEGVKIAIVP